MFGILKKEIVGMSGFSRKKLAFFYTRNFDFSVYNVVKRMIRLFCRDFKLSPQGKNKNVQIR